MEVKGQHVQTWLLKNTLIAIQSFDEGTCLKVVLALDDGMRPMEKEVTYSSCGQLAMTTTLPL
ncbi:hypothetical protein BSL78_11369 [Apostichopus japonicus]|uniref:Uncharacterized protein n=1 Tax=Stichopus japonicus TaxID=307972 RepID=A0A2G8KUP7_STIJA|nr:hypothetical protein BSL78_11369 [Apostichopus japonicus]